MNKLLQENSNLLIIKPTSLGDVIQSLVCVCAIRNSFPSVKISYLVADFYACILKNHADIDEVIEFPISQMRKGVKGLLEARKKLKADLSSRNFDVSLDLQGLARSAIAGKYTKAPVKAGFSDARELAPLFYTHKINSNRLRENAIDIYLNAARFLGAEAKREDVAFNLVPDNSAVRSVQRLVRSDDYCIVFPGARWETKKWCVEGFVSVASALVEKYGLKIVVGGSRGEKSLGDEIASKLPSRSCMNIAGITNLPEMIAAISLSNIAITNDSGPMHAAAALGIPTVSIFGPTSPERIAPWGQEEGVIWSSEECRGCYLRKCRTIPPPCMAKVTSRQVIEACERILASRSKQ